MPDKRSKVKPRRPPGQEHVKSRETRPGSTNDQPPHFSLCYLMDGFRVSDCQRDDKAAFAERLQELSAMTWGQIMLAPRVGLGTEVIDQASIKRPIPPRITPEVTLLSWRFGGGARVIGYREDRLFHLLWIDPNHDAYKG